MNYSTTTNGAVQYKTSNDECVDLFSKIGSMRHWRRREVLEYFEKAFEHNPELTTRITYWARAAREGSGERKTFYTILDEIARTSPDFISDNARTLAQIGYWKDLIRYFDIPKVVSVFAQSIKDGDRLANKWAPRKGEVAKMLRNKLGYTNKEYRKWLKKHSDTVETQMSEKDWNEIKYSSVPGSAMRKYSKAYTRNDSQRFEDWKNDSNSKASVSATYPHQVLNMIDEDEQLAEKLWNNLPDLLSESDDNILPMIDTSGSMFGEPLAIAISLGMYLAERSKGEFKDMFLSFSESPKLVKIVGDNVQERLSNIAEYSDWGMNTDFEKAYMHILRLAKKHNVMKDSMPSMLLVLSDMQFDESQRGVTHFEHMKEEYEKAGYELPKIVFWNLDCLPGTPAECSDDSVAMVSGYSPSIMKAILNAEEFNPLSIMMEALEDIKIDYTNLPTKFKYRKEI